MAVQNGYLKGTINFFDKIAIFKRFREGLGRVWEGFGGGFGRVLGRFGQCLGAFGRSRDLSASFWAFLRRFGVFWVVFCMSFVILATFC